ncbi:serine hydrolase domain-containing protein [Sphingobium nicotianae]|uniref:Beta-lactamase family protein n=1 Tax=Sphingobium nicotianae TaxID=2782607 RepID=A0A9X1DCJ6_9SPHN|nr:serine hydrolase domain-containing protein [Sphingobium nicotianae]MBT2187446.1 beta-lactamase family protein [Sphingobium nicotianae]
MAITDFVADRRQFFGLLGAAAAMPSVALAKAAVAATHPAMKALIDRYVAERKVANMVVAVGGREGPPAFLSAGTLELGEGVPASPDTLYRIYSMSKCITGCAVMMLVEDGKLTLDTPLSAIFPGYAQMTVLTDPANSLASRPAVKPILIRHLVTHSAGLAYGSTAPAPLAKFYAEKGIETASAMRDGQSRRPANLIEFAEAAAGVPLLFEPGSGWNYSIGLDVAGAVVEKVSGMKFELFLERRILAPLGMADTGFMVPPARLDRFATNYKHTLTGLEVIDTREHSVFTRMPAIPSGGGGLISSTRDYARFMAMLLGEGRLGRTRILKIATALTMMSNLMEPGVLAKTGFGTGGYGAGGRSVITATPGGEGLGTYGWSGAANSVTWVDRASGLYIVLMTQIMQWWPNPIYDDANHALYGDLHRA